MDIYLAGRYDYRDQMRERAKQLRELGHTCVSDWVMGDHDRTPPDSCARIDIQDIKIADEFVVFLDPLEVPARRGGKHFEAGLAFGLRIPIVAIGPKEADDRYENVFYHHETVKHFDTWEDYLACLRGRK